jgi:hypothetical protein
MSDEYICRVCGHRAGDHAVNNICLVEGCDCKDDPYLEQLALITAERDALAKKLEFAVGVLKYKADNDDDEALAALFEIERIGKV